MSNRLVSSDLKFGCPFIQTNSEKSIHKNGQHYKDNKAYYNMQCEWEGMLAGIFGYDSWT